jgi:AraC-like DNA-binding protein/mannose-6-phosphate isomerase-like protein (cupin superfamily)
MHKLAGLLHGLTRRGSFVRDLRTFFRYLPVSPESRAWGAYVLDAGFALIPPGMTYPPCRHPADHDFTWELGRVLHAHQFIYITRGRGRFESGVGGGHEIQAGDLFVVHPEVWHRYRPHPETGWDEYWIEIDGDYIRRLMKHEAFRQETPVHHLGAQPALLQLYTDALDLLRRQPAEFQFLLGALAVQIMAQTLSARQRQSIEGRPVDDIIKEAKRLLIRPQGRAMPLEAFAAQFNMSYSAFRRLFKARTGYAPRQFAVEVGLERAKDLLRRSAQPIHAIAEECGFQSPFYFSRFIKQRTGLSPTEFRKAPFEGI